MPGKDVTELPQYMQESTFELSEHKKDLEVLHSLLKEISNHGLPGDKALVFEKTNNFSKKFKEMEDTIKEKKKLCLLVKNRWMLSKCLLSHSSHG